MKKFLLHKCNKSNKNIIRISILNKKNNNNTNMTEKGDKTETLITTRFSYKVRDFKQRKLEVRL